MTYLIGVAGISGSGKSTFTGLLAQHFQLWGLSHHILSLDDCYRDQGCVPEKERKQFCFDPKRNYDHPDFLDQLKMEWYSKNLKEGEPFNYPHYNFETHSYSSSEQTHVPGDLDIAIVEGILSLHFETLLNRYDKAIFLEAHPVIAALRRAGRDVNDRGRNFTEISEQMTKTVVPMQERYVLPSKINADFIVKWWGGESEDPQKVKKQLRDLAYQNALFFYHELLELEKINPQETSINPPLPKVSLEDIAQV